MLTSQAEMKGSKAGVKRTLQILSICFFLFPAWMAALDPSQRISQYGHTSWKIQDGYFGSQPVSITQTTDGYLWVETEGGIFRFDGVQFVSWTSLTGEKLPSNDYWPMLGARDGSLYIATDSGLLRGQTSAQIHFAQLAGQTFVVTVTEPVIERSRTPQGLSRRTLRAVFG
jgi:ligand-binding sensor domain-containing protein